MFRAVYSVRSRLRVRRRGVVHVVRFVARPLYSVRWGGVWWVRGPVVAVLFALRLPSARGAWLCRPSWGSGRCAIGSLHGWVGFLPVVCCTPCGWGLGCVHLVLVLSSYRWGCRGRWCCAAEYDCSPFFVCYTPCGLGSGYAEVMWCLRFSLWRGRCSRYIVMRRGLVPGPPVVVLSFAPLSPSPLGARLCQWCWGNGPCAIGSLLPAVHCTPCGSGLGFVRLVLVLGS